MKKLFALVCAMALALGAMLCLSACGNTKESTEVQTGLVCDIETDENGEKYAIVEKFTISDEDAKKISENDFDAFTAEERKLVLNTYTTTEVVDGKEVEVTYPIREISAAAFANQLIFKEIVFGANVEKIGEGCLAGCTNLEKLTVKFVGGEENALNSAKTIGYLFGAAEVTSATKVTMYYNASGSKTYYIPDSLKTVIVTGDVLSAYAFNATTIKTIELQGNVEEIPESAFANMTSLETLTIPATVKTIGKNAFKGATTLYKVDFSKATSLETIYQDAFAGCAMLGSGNNNDVIIPSLTTIYSGAFKNCAQLKNVDVSATNIVNIPSDCFYGCEKLETLKYSSKVTSVGNDAIPSTTTVTIVTE